MHFCGSELVSENHRCCYTDHFSGKHTYILCFDWYFLSTYFTVKCLRSHVRFPKPITYIHVCVPQFFKLNFNSLPVKLHCCNFAQTTNFNDNSWWEKNLENVIIYATNYNNNLSFSYKSLKIVCFTCRYLFSIKISYEQYNV